MVMGLFVCLGGIYGFLGELTQFLTARRNFSLFFPVGAFTLTGCRGLWNQVLRVIGSGFGFLNC
jgi:hypothetical protein